MKRVNTWSALPSMTKRRMISIIIAIAMVLSIIPAMPGVALVALLDVCPALCSQICEDDSCDKTHAYICNDCEKCIEKYGVMVNIDLGKHITDDVNRITDAMLAQMVSDGTIPANVTHLDLGNNQISDISPLSSLTKLRWLVLNNNQIVDISPLSELSDIWVLHLETNRITDITPLSKLTNLQVLALAQNKINDITPLNKLTNLFYLNLSYNQINDLTPLNTLTKLEFLALQQNQINDLTPLNTLTKLEILGLGYNQINDLIPLKSLKDLRNLAVQDNLFNLANVKALENLLPQCDVYHNAICDGCCGDPDLLCPGCNRYTVDPHPIICEFHNTMSCQPSDCTPCPLFDCDAVCGEDCVTVSCSVCNRHNCNCISDCVVHFGNCDQMCINVGCDMMYYCRMPDCTICYPDTYTDCFVLGCDWYCPEHHTLCGLWDCTICNPLKCQDCFTGLAYSLDYWCCPEHNKFCGNSECKKCTSFDLECPHCGAFGCPYRCPHGKRACQPVCYECEPHPCQLSACYLSTCKICNPIDCWNCYVIDWCCPEHNNLCQKISCGNCYTMFCPGCNSIAEHAVRCRNVAITGHTNLICQPYQCTPCPLLDCTAACGEDCVTISCGDCNRHNCNCPVYVYCYNHYGICGQTCMNADCDEVYRCRILTCTNCNNHEHECIGICGQGCALINCNKGYFCESMSCVNCNPHLLCNGTCDDCKISSAIDYNSNFIPGHILSNDQPISISDALEILIFLADMSESVINNGGQGSRAWNAALIVDTNAERPSIIDALHILMYLVDMPESKLYKQ